MSITFNDICKLLEGVEKISARRPRLSIEREKLAIQQHIAGWFQTHRELLDSPATNGGAVLSALFPHRRKDRVYGLQAPALSKKITKLMNFNRRQRALYERWADGIHGDLGVYTERAMGPWNGTFKNKSSIPLERVEHLLVQLASKYRFSDPATQKQRVWHFSTNAELKNVFVKLESWEAKWLVRLILRDYCTIELDEKYVLKTYHFLLPELLMFQNDFDAVFDMLQRELKSYPPVPTRRTEKTMRIEAAQRLRAVVGIKVGRPTFHKAWSFKNCFQLTSDRAWAAEVKYDGEYCEIHVNLDKSPNDMVIFSKNGKDATNDRQALHGTIRKALRVGRPDCMFKNKCIVLGELVLYSDKEQKILPFSKIRKHISRSGSFIGTLQDSLPHEWEHLMVVFFDVLVVDDEQVMRKCFQERRRILRELVETIPGHAARSEWTLIDLKTAEGITDLKQTFAKSIAHRQEGLVLKPLHAPYFSLLAEVGHRQPGFFIKLKKDYLNDMGGERDLGDFAVMGASFDAQVAAKSDVKPLHWTHFHIGCLVNKTAIERTQARPKFKIVGALSMDKCIPKPVLRYLNNNGRLREVSLGSNGKTEHFDIEHSFGYGLKMSVAFKEPFVVEILGGGYEKLQNETFEMLRHPRIKRIHHDRGWEDTVTIDDLARMAEQKWDVPDAETLDGHARDVAVLVQKYAKELHGSQLTASEWEMTPETTQRTTPRTTQETPRRAAQATPDDAVVLETQQISTPGTWATSSTTQFSSSTQGNGIKASRQLRVLVREDTLERIAPSPVPQAAQKAVGILTPPTASADKVSTSSVKRSASGTIVSPPAVKRRKTRTPLKDSGTNRKVGTFDYDSQEKTIHIYAEAGLKVQVHSS